MGVVKVEEKGEKTKTVIKWTHLFSRYRHLTVESWVSRTLLVSIRSSDGCLWNNPVTSKDSLSSPKRIILFFSATDFSPSSFGSLNLKSPNLDLNVIWHSYVLVFKYTVGSKRSATEARVQRKELLCISSRYLIHSVTKFTPCARGASSEKLTVFRLMRSIAVHTNRCHTHLYMHSSEHIVSTNHRQILCPWK